MNRLSNALRTNLTKAYLEEFELSLPEWRLLALVARFSPLRFSEVTSRSGMDKGQVSRTLRVMAKRGLTKMKIIRERGSRSAEALAAPVMVSITGSTRAGIAVATAAAADVKVAHIELGGKAPVVVFNDADLPSAVEGIKVAGYFNGGQDCTAATRVRCQSGIYDNFVDERASAAAATRTGYDPDDEEVF